MVRNLELVRALFRRPLELWLLLDRCLYLVEQGYSVRLGEFCPTFLSPRNLLILAGAADTGVPDGCPHNLWISLVTSSGKHLPRGPYPGAVNAVQK